jgi:DNA-binding transcriptional LysR family regulator
MDPRRVLTFRAVAHARSFTAAARELALTQPAVSQQVAGLEAELGAPLLVREPGGLRLTRAGEVLLEHADVVAERLGLAAAQIAELARAERARLRIGAFSSALAGLVPELVERLRRTSPDVEVLVQEDDSAALADRVLKGELHLSLAFQDVALPRREHAGLERHDVLREPFLVAVHAGHPLAGRKQIELAELADDPWSAASTDGLIARACGQAGFVPRIVAIARDPIAIREFVARGTAVTLVPRLLAPGLGGLVFLELTGDPPRRDVYALLPPGGRHPLLDDALAALSEVASALA